MLQLSFPPSNFSCLCPCSSHLRGLGVRLLHWDREGNSQEVSVFIGKKPQRFFQPVKWAHHPLATTQQSLDGHCEGPRAGRYFQQHSQTPALLSSVPGHPKCSPHRNTNSAHPFMLWGATSSLPTVTIAIPAQQPAACHAQATSVLFCVSASRNDKDIVVRSTQLLQLHTRLLERKE